ncbi:MAG: putative glycoside hydrolase [Elusimicrobia bacterium]|nr:putative glycoside hydrolase [Elusimicrobiota bacterium]
MLKTLFFLLLGAVTASSAQSSLSTAAVSAQAPLSTAIVSAQAPLSTAVVSAQFQAGAAASVAVSTTAIREKILSEKPVRGIHLTSWGAGSKKLRAGLIGKIKNSVINTVVVAVKETDGKVYIPGVEKAHRYGTYTPAIAEPEEMLRDFKEARLYTVARIVVFKDQILPRQRRDLAVRAPDGNLWRSNNGATWLDPYNKEVWAYALDVAEHAAKLGFDEIQFDYLRHPSEGKISLCRYSKPHNAKNAIANLKEFLIYAGGRLKPYNIKLSVDVFGLTTTAKDDLGIGQDLRTIAKHVDYVYPMMYPSHYYSGTYNLKNPNSQPYKVIDRGLRDALKRLGDDYTKLRPFLQDFSMGKHYGPHEVRAQIMAARKNLLESWVLWNPGNRYTWAALTPQSYRAFVDPEYGGGQGSKESSGER